MRYSRCVADERLVKRRTTGRYSDAPDLLVQGMCTCVIRQCIPPDAFVKEYRCLGTRQTLRKKAQALELQQHT